MLLYTLNATPVRNFKQLTEDEQRSIKHGDDTLKAINSRNIEQFPDMVAEVLAKYDIDGFTIYPVQGYWKGEPEQSFKIEFAIDNQLYAVDVADELRKKWNQEAVMLTNGDNTVEFI